MPLYACTISMCFYYSKIESWLQNWNLIWKFKLNAFRRVYFYWGYLMGICQAHAVDYWDFLQSKLVITWPDHIFFQSGVLAYHIPWGSLYCLRIHQCFTLHFLFFIWNPRQSISHLLCIMSTKFSSWSCYARKYYLKKIFLLLDVLLTDHITPFLSLQSKMEDKLV